MAGRLIAVVNFIRNASSTLRRYFMISALSFNVPGAERPIFGDLWRAGRACEMIIVPSRQAERRAGGCRLLPARGLNAHLSALWARACGMIGPLDGRSRCDET